MAGRPTGVPPGRDAAPGPLGPLQPGTVPPAPGLPAPPRRAACSPEAGRFLIQSQCGLRGVRAWSGRCWEGEPEGWGRQGVGEVGWGGVEGGGRRSSLPSESPVRVCAEGKPGVAESNMCSAAGGIGWECGGLSAARGGLQRPEIMPREKSPLRQHSSKRRARQKSTVTTRSQRRRPPRPPLPLRVSGRHKYRDSDKAQARCTLWKNLNPPIHRQAKSGRTYFRRCSVPGPPAGAGTGRDCTLGSCQPEWARRPGPAGT
jgi:hypothetical protein